MRQKYILQKKTILFVIPSLAGGGAERVMVNLITHLERSRYDIRLVLFEKKGKYLSALPAHVKVYDLKKKNICSYVRLVFLLAVILRKTKPVTVVSFLDYANMITIIAKFLSFRKARLIISSRSFLHKELISKKFKGLSFILYKYLSRYADYIVVNSLESKNRFIQLLESNPDTVRVIYNPLDINAIDKQKEAHIDFDFLAGYILAVGRLSREKGFLYLLRAYALIKEKINEKLVILGEGPDEQMLKSLTKDLGIQKEVYFLGFQNNPYKFMKNASIFVLSSLNEGFPNVLIEAMACRTSVVATNCTSGPGEIIENHKNGILVPPADENALAEAIVDLLKNKNLRMKFSETGRERAMEFSVETILPQFEKLF